MPKTTIPNLQWYAKISKGNGVSTHCPFATVEACPRYYQSLSLLGNAGSTKIRKEEDERLLAKWQATDLWPRTAEYETSTSSPGNGTPTIFSLFCPEVTFDRFGYFATHLGNYVDEIDKDLACKRLAEESVPIEDPRWYWGSISPQHYTECQLYAVLLHRYESEKMRNEGAMTQNYNFNAKVGSVQTGANANANIVLNLSEKEQTAVLAALAQIRNALEVSGKFNPQSSELLAIADEAKEIILSPNPNSTKLRAYFDILSSSVQGIASAQPAYQTFKLALSTLGITLP